MHPFCGLYLYSLSGTNVMFCFAVTSRDRSYYGGPALCCHRISLLKFGDWPAPLDRLMRFDGDTASSRFMRSIR